MPDERCPKCDHRLQKHNNGRRKTCDKCDEDDLYETYRCRRCNYDVCYECIEQSEESSEESEEQESKSQRGNFGRNIYSPANLYPANPCPAKLYQPANLYPSNQAREQRSLPGRAAPAMPELYKRTGGNQMGFLRVNAEYAQGRDETTYNQTTSNYEKNTCWAHGCASVIRNHLWRQSRQVPEHRVVYDRAIDLKKSLGYKHDDNDSNTHGARTLNDLKKIFQTICRDYGLSCLGPMKANQAIKAYNEGDPGFMLCGMPIFSGAGAAGGGSIGGSETFSGEFKTMHATVVRALAQKCCRCSENLLNSSKIAKCLKCGKKCTVKTCRKNCYPACEGCALAVHSYMKFKDDNGPGGEMRIFCSAIQQNAQFDFWKIVD